MRILLTNDDGYDAEGLASLYDAVKRLPDVQIDVSAPAEVQSGQGHRVSREVKHHRGSADRIGDLTIVHGTPPDCVRVGLFAPGRLRPDWVVSGINHGGNLGVDVYYSGTVAAAREAAIYGIPAIAVSQLIKNPPHDQWPRTTNETAAVIAAILLNTATPPPGIDVSIFNATRASILKHQPATVTSAAFWNVNLPKHPPDQPPRGVRLTPVSYDPVDVTFGHEAGTNDDFMMLNNGDYHARPATPGTDVAAVYEGFISISRIAV